MGKAKEAVVAVTTFVSDVLGETKKASWPSRQELVSSTVVVIVSLLLLSLFVWLSDSVLLFVLQSLTGAGGS